MYPNHFYEQNNTITTPNIPRSVRNSNRNRLARLFAVTIPHTEITKEHVFMSLDALCDQLVVASETHFNSEYHHHLFLRCREKYTRQQLKDMFAVIYNITDPDENESDDEFTNDQQERAWIGTRKIHVTTVRNVINYLKYITKYDQSPLFKGRYIENQFSFYYKALKWAQNTNQFGFADSFVLNNPQYYKLLKECHEEVQNLKTKRPILTLKPVPYELIKQHLKTIEQNNETNQCNNTNNNNNYSNNNNNTNSHTLFATHSNSTTITTIDGTLPIENYFENQDNWHKKVVDWFNDWVINGYRHKKKQLYLWGPSNTGKSTFINTLIELSLKISAQETIENINEDEFDLNYEDQIMRPTPNDKCFAWQSYNEKQHNLVVIEEFHVSEYCVADMKKLLAGETFVANVKNGRSRKIKLQMPMVLISNFDPPSESSSIEYRGVVERLNVIKADKLIKY